MAVFNSYITSTFADDFTDNEKKMKLFCMSQTLLGETETDGKVLFLIF